ncbi:7046_t:CDS:10 [Acaulospora morrowiae]|uniref:7046_t:CDS:1 n=1 Tax=Acaulospora morrowiae TaxID=94023 RepID=A0A9N9ACG1_9GLOM|nr:7046_t:CDS:10 [Acaulospora morrowiae]
MIPNGGRQNPFSCAVKRESETFRGATSYTPEEFERIQEKLSKQLGPEFISSRPGPAGAGKLIYIEGWKLINLANSVFGFNGWSSSIEDLTVDFVDCSDTGRYSVGVSANCKVILKDGTYHADVGYGSCENQKSKAAAFEKAKKEAMTDALKRALRTFGNMLGNCLYSRNYTAEIVKIKTPPVKLDVNNLYRLPEFSRPNDSCKNVTGQGNNANEISCTQREGVSSLSYSKNQDQSHNRSSIASSSQHLINNCSQNILNQPFNKSNIQATFGNPDSRQTNQLHNSPNQSNNTSHTSRSLSLRKQVTGNGTSAATDLHKTTDRENTSDPQVSTSFNTFGTQATNENVSNQTGDSKNSKVPIYKSANQIHNKDGSTGPSLNQANRESSSAASENVSTSKSIFLNIRSEKANVKAESVSTPVKELPNKNSIPTKPTGTDLDKPSPATIAAMYAEFDDKMGSFFSDFMVDETGIEFDDSFMFSCAADFQNARTNQSPLSKDCLVFDGDCSPIKRTEKNFTYEGVPDLNSPDEKFVQMKAQTNCNFTLSPQKTKASPKKQVQNHRKDLKLSDSTNVDQNTGKKRLNPSENAFVKSVAPKIVSNFNELNQSMKKRRV